MLRILHQAAVACAVLAASQAASAQPHWTCEGEAGPANWGQFDPQFV